MSPWLPTGTTYCQQAHCTEVLWYSRFCWPPNPCENSQAWSGNFSIDIIRFFRCFWIVFWFWARIFGLKLVNAVSWRVFSRLVSKNNEKNIEKDRKIKNSLGPKKSIKIWKIKIFQIGQKICQAYCFYFLKCPKPSSNSQNSRSGPKKTEGWALNYLTQFI